MGAGNLRFMRVVQFIFSARKISTDVPDGWEMFNFILSGGGFSRQSVSQALRLDRVIYWALYNASSVLVQIL